VVVVTEIGVAAVCEYKLFVGKGKLARVHEEKGKELGANLDRSGRSSKPSTSPKPGGQSVSARKSGASFVIGQNRFGSSIRGKARC
jgi:hypothetical protein